MTGTATWTIILGLIGTWLLTFGTASQVALNRVEDKSFRRALQDQPDGAVAMLVALFGRAPAGGPPLQRRARQQVRGWWALTLGAMVAHIAAWATVGHPWAVVIGAASAASATVLAYKLYTE